MIIKLGLLLGFFCVSQAVQEAQALEYDFSPNSIKTTKFSKYFTDTDVDSLEISAFDLNDDGIEEYIVRSPSGCAQNERCEYKVLAETPHKLVLLAKLEGLNITVDQNYSHGIRNLRLFDSEMNDFDYKLYVWEPLSTQYVEKQKASDE